jgi:hypothetical protein
MIHVGCIQTGIKKSPRIKVAIKLKVGSQVTL